MRTTCRVPTMVRTMAVLTLAFLAFACLGDILRPAMATAAGHDCFGAVCEEQIGCGQPASPGVPPTSALHPIPLPSSSGVPTVALQPVSAWPGRLSPPGVDQPSIAPFAPRSPPLA